MRKMAYVLICIITLALLSGCEDMTSHTGQYNNNNSLIDKVPFNPPEIERVEWMTMIGGLGGFTTKVMFSGHDDAVIKKVIDMINQNKEMHTMDNRQVEAIFQKIRPIGLVISLTGGDCYYLWPSYDIVNHSDGWTDTTLTDRFTLQIDENGDSSFYTVFSGEAADYIINGWKSDMPEVEAIKIESDSAAYNEHGLIISDGDNIRVHGDGCPYSEVVINIRKNGGNASYNLGHAKAEYGLWQWEGVISRNINKTDGNSILLEDGLYDIVIIMGKREKAICGVVKLK